MERWISLGILCPTSVNIDGELIPRMQEQFIYNLPNHKMYETTDETNVLIFWDKISISENTNMNDKIREIQDAIDNRNVIVVDSGKTPNLLKKKFDTILSLIGGGVFTLIAYFLPK